MKTLRMLAMLALVGALSPACSGDDDDDSSPAATAGAAGAATDGAAGAEGAATQEPFELIGKYDDDFGGEQIITASDWNGDAIVAYDNDANVVYTQFADDAMFNAGKFAKTVYTEPEDGAFYFCMVEYSLATLEEALESQTSADASDPEQAGCGGFPWTKATPQ